MKDNELLLLLGAVLLFLWWKRRQAEQAPSSVVGGAALGVPPAPAPAISTATKTFRQTPVGSPGNGPAPLKRPSPGYTPGLSTKPPPSTLDKTQAAFQKGAQSYLQAAGVPSALAAPIAKYGNTIADARYVVKGAEVVGSGVKKGAEAVGSAAVSAGKAIGNAVSSAFSFL